MAKPPKSPRIIDALKHAGASRINIPTAEMESFFRREEDTAPMPPKHYPRARPLTPGTTRTAEEPAKPELIWKGATISISDDQMQELAETGRLTLSDAQLVWRGKDRQDWSDLVVNVPPLYIQEKIHPKAIIDDLKRQSSLAKRWRGTAAGGGGGAPSDGFAATSPVNGGGYQPDLFSDFNGIEPDQRAEFYQHDQHWSNRMILGDSLQVMASLSERESLRGKVQCIYFDPPYGIKFNSNWQVSTQSRDVRDGKQADISREPEQVKAFRDTWKDGIHSYLTYLRDRLTAMRDLLTESGSIFVQIGDENVHRVRTVMDEVFGGDNFFRTITIRKTAGDTAAVLKPQADYILWAAKDIQRMKGRNLFLGKEVGEGAGSQYDRALSLSSRRTRRLTSAETSNIKTLPEEFIPYRTADLRRQGFSRTATIDFPFESKKRHPGATRQWKTSEAGLTRLRKSDRLELVGNTLEYRRLHEDWPVSELTNIWMDAGGSGFGDPRIYVVQTITRVVERCILMATDPGDLVLDPTCGSGTTAFVAEQWAGAGSPWTPAASRWRLPAPG